MQLDKTFEITYIDDLGRERTATETVKTRKLNGWECKSLLYGRYYHKDDVVDVKSIREICV